MGFLIDAFEFIINTINSIWDFVTGFFEYLGVALSLLTSMFRFSMSFINSFPPYLKTFGTITIFVSVLFFILNRESGN